MIIVFIASLFISALLVAPILLYVNNNDKPDEQRKSSLLVNILVESGRFTKPSMQRVALVGLALIVLATVGGAGGWFKLFTPSPLLGSIVGINLANALFVFYVLTSRDRHQELLLLDLQFFARQLIMISIAGKTLEEGLRIIVDVSLARSRCGPIELILQHAFEIRSNHPSFNEALLVAAKAARSPELLRLLHIKLQSEAHGSEVTRLIEDLIEEAKIRAMVFDQSAQTGVGKFIYGTTHLIREPRILEFHKTFPYFLLSFKGLLRTGRDPLSCLTLYAEGESENTIMKEEIDLMNNRIRHGMVAKTALANFGSTIQDRTMDLFVQTLMMNYASPGILSNALQHVFHEASAKSLRG